jgi:hypothetical protein
METFTLDCKTSDSVNHPMSLNKPLRMAQIKDNSQEMSVCHAAHKFLEVRGRDAQMLRRRLFLLRHCAAIYSSVVSRRIKGYEAVTYQNLLN